MATPDGRVTFEAGGRSHVLQFTTNRVCLAEDKLGKTSLDIAVELEMNPKLNTIRTLFWAALGDDGMTLAQIGDMMDEIGRTDAVELARSAFMASFPPRSDDDGKEGGENPPVASAG